MKQKGNKIYTAVPFQKYILYTFSFTDGVKEESNDTKRAKWANGEI